MKPKNNEKPHTARHLLIQGSPKNASATAKKKTLHSKQKVVGIQILKVSVSAALKI